MSDLPGTSLRLKSGLTTEALLASIRGGEMKRTPASVPNENPDQIQAWRLAAAVLHVYNPATLKPYGQSPKSAADILFSESAPAIGWRNENYRTLRTTIRSTALTELATRQRMRECLAANPEREVTGVQALFEAWLEQKIDLHGLRYEQLEDMRQLYDWGLEALGGLPKRKAFDRLRARRAGVALFEHLVDNSFVGRRAELQRLREFVGVVEPSVWAKVRAFLDRGPRAPLILSGKGGVGKTALLGRFLLEYVDNTENGWFPFVYLPFDSESIDVRQPWTLLAAATDQLATQMMPAGADDIPSEIASAFANFRGAIAQFRSERASTIARATSDATQAFRNSRSLATEDMLGKEFGTLLSIIASFSAARQEARDVPVVLILDSFEEVVYRTDEDLLGLWRMLTTIQESFSALRVVIAGRTEPRPFQIGGRQPSSVILDDLIESDALVMLEKLGVANPVARASIVRQVGRSPLTLRLAARAAQQEAIEAKGFVSLDTRTWYGWRLAGNVIRGQLYRRILDHIHDEGVRVLAHPGMALRKVTPQLIENVLAPVCMHQAIDGARANELFEALRREHSLVRLDDDSSLRYREEVRTPMLGLLARDKPEQLAELRERAVAFYVSTDGAPAERAEELYNRMMLQQDPTLLDGRWMPGVERYLASSVEELPTVQKVWLARHMSIELPKDVYQQADVTAWEELVGGKALELSRYGTAEDVVRLLHERTDRTPESSLYAIEMRALMNLGRFMDALSLGKRAMDGWTMANPGRLCEVLWLASQAAKQGNLPGEAAGLLLQMVEIAGDLSSRLPEAQGLTDLLSFAPNERKIELQGRLAGALDKLTDAEIDSERSLVRLACLRLGTGYPSVLKKMLRYVLSELSLLIGSKRIDVSDAASQAHQALQLADPGVWAATHFEDPVAFAQGLIELVYQSPTIAVLEAVLRIMAAEKADLSAATLSGINDYRQSFELRAAPESMS